MVNPRYIIQGAIFAFLLLPNSSCEDSTENSKPTSVVIKVVDVYTSQPIAGASVYLPICISSQCEYCGCSSYTAVSSGYTKSDGSIEVPVGQSEFSIMHPDYIEYYYGFQSEYNCKNQEGGVGRLFPDGTYALYPKATVKFIIHGNGKFASTDYYNIDAYSFFETGRNPFSGDVEYCFKPAIDLLTIGFWFPANRDTIFYSYSTGDKTVEVKINYMISGQSILKEFSYSTPRDKETVIEIPSLN